MKTALTVMLDQGDRSANSGHPVSFNQDSMLLLKNCERCEYV